MYLCVLIQYVRWALPRSTAAGRPERELSQLAAHERPSDGRDNFNAVMSVPALRIETIRAPRRQSGEMLAAGLTRIPKFNPYDIPHGDTG